MISILDEYESVSLWLQIGISQSGWLHMLFVTLSEVL